MRMLMLCCLLLTGCATSADHADVQKITGVVHSGCGAAEGGATYLALDANDHFVIVHADGSWGNGGERGWDLQPGSRDFSVLVCDEGATSCGAATKAHFAIESGTKSMLYGKISYETATLKREFAFQAVRTDINQPMQFCG